MQYKIEAQELMYVVKLHFCISGFYHSYPFTYERNPY